MATFADAYSAIKTKLTAEFTAITLRWLNDAETIPDTPVPFAFVEVLTDDAFYAGFGGGRGANLQRTIGRIEAHVLVDRTGGATALANGQANAESIAAVFRSYRDATISCFAAGVFPPFVGPPFSGNAAASGNYRHIATAIIDFHFDQTG